MCSATARTTPATRVHRYGGGACRAHAGHSNTNPDQTSQELDSDSATITGIVRDDGSAGTAAACRSGTHDGVTNPRRTSVDFQIVAAPPNGRGSSTLRPRDRDVRVHRRSRSSDESWPHHFVGVLDGHALYAVDVPDGDRPERRRARRSPPAVHDGRRGHVDRDRTRGPARRVGADPSVLRALRHPDRSIGAVHLDGVPGLRPPGVSAPVAGDDHARHSRRRRPRSGGAARSWRRLAGRIVVVPGRVRRGRRDTRGVRRARGPRGGRVHGRTTSAIRARSHGRSRTA